MTQPCSAYPSKEKQGTDTKEQGNGDERTENSAEETGRSRIAPGDPAALRRYAPDHDTTVRSIASSSSTPSAKIEPGRPPRNIGRRIGSADHQASHLPSRRIDAMLRFPCSIVDSGLMPARRAAPSSTPPPKRARSQAKEPTLDALLAALAERERELAEAREQQAAVAEVLQIINASPGDLGPVFDAIVREGARLCDANNGTLWLVEDGTARLVDTLSRGPRASYLETVPAADLLGRDAQDRPFLHIEDLKATKAYRNGVPLIVGSVEVHGARTVLSCRSSMAGGVVGVFTLDRNEVRPIRTGRSRLRKRSRARR